MTLLHLLKDGALAAAEMLALLIVPPAMAAQPAPVAAVEQPVRWHRTAAAMDARLLGTLAGVRAVQSPDHQGAARANLADAAAPLRAPSEDERSASRAAAANQWSTPGDCGDDDARPAGHARLTEDEALADAWHSEVRPADAVLEIGRQWQRRLARAYSLSPSADITRSTARALLIDHGDQQFVMIVAHRTAATAHLVLRPAGAPEQCIELGAIDAGRALFIALEDRAHVEALAHGAIELELKVDASTVWATLTADRVDSASGLQAGVAE